MTTEQRGCCAELHSSVSAEEQLEQKLWEEILQQKGLSMDRGLTRRVGYGAKYFDSAKTIEYGTSDRYARQRGDNHTYVEKVLRLMDSGMSMRAAARKMGVDAGNVCNALRRHREHSARCAELHSSEGNDQ